MDYKKFNVFASKEKKVVEKEGDLFEDSERPQMIFGKFIKDIINGSYVLDQVKDLPVLVNGKPIDHVNYGGNGGVNFVSGEFSDKLQLGEIKTDDMFDAPLDKNGFQKKSLLTFSKLLEDLKSNKHDLGQVKDLPVLVNGKPIEGVNFGRNGGVDFFSKN